MIMDERHGFDAVLGHLEYFDGSLLSEMFGLKIEQAVDDLHVVLHPVVNFSEQCLFFLERGLHVGFRPLVAGSERTPAQGNERITIVFTKPAPAKPQGE